LAAFVQIGVTLPRTAAAQQNWVAQGNGYRVPLGQERPGDLIFTDSYLGPNRVGHVMIVFNPAEQLTIEAGGSRVGHYDYGHWTDHHLFSIWRVGAVAS
ncbi:MAG: C40 family peptidase, partial [Actinobacteria bacterium]|nr:C40 family peptidase [Actinomycetota bacterium]